jgi:hypothetical protein
MSAYAVYQPSQIAWQDAKARDRVERSASAGGAVLVRPTGLNRPFTRKRYQ